jgi:hypothetical protein
LRVEPGGAQSNVMQPKSRSRVSDRARFRSPAHLPARIAL